VREPPIKDVIEKHFIELCKLKVSENVTVRIGQLRQNFDALEGDCSQFMCMVIEHATDDQRILLRLSTFRKIMGWVIRRGWQVARCLRTTEKRILDIKAKRKDL